MSARHSDQKPADGIHVPYSFTYADSTARTGDTSLTSDDVGKFARQTDNDSIWMLTSTSPTWVEVTNVSSSAAVNKIDIKTIADTGVSISKGDLLYLVGHDDANSAVIADKAKADAGATMPAFAIATESISDSSTGSARVSGKVFSLDTSSFSVGDTLHVSDSTAGAFLNPAPSGPSISQPVAEVLKSDASSGIVFAKIETFIHLSDQDPQPHGPTATSGTGTRAARIDHVHPDPRRTEVEVRNESGSAIPVNKAITVVGYNSTENLVTVDLADKDTDDPAIAVTNEEIPDTSNGTALVRGRLEGYDTSAWSLGDQLVLSNSGDLVLRPPTGPESTGIVQNIATVTRVDPTSGQLDVSVGGQGGLTFPEALNVNQSLPRGLDTGGVLSDAGGLDLDVTAGKGFVSDANGRLQEVVWSDTTITLTDNAELLIYVDGSGTVQSSTSHPSNIENIHLGTVETGGGTIRLISRHFVTTNNPVTAAHDYRHEVIGPVAITGVDATINDSDGTKFDVSSGEFTTGDEVLEIGSVSTPSFTYWWQDGSGSWDHAGGSTSIDLTQYDDGSGTLAALPTDKVKADRIFVSWDGSSTNFHVVYGQTLFDSVSAAASAAEPNVPDSLRGFALRIGEAIVVEGESSINTINDIRSFLGQNEGKQEELSTDHGTLVGLGDDDHCFSEDTELLTTDGWVSVDEIEAKETVAATFNTETENIEPSLVCGKYVYDDFDEMVRFTARATDILVTPEHEMVYRTVNPDRKPGWSWQKTEAKDLVDYSDALTFPMAGEQKDIRLPHTDEYIKLLGWLASEGHAVGQNECGHGYKVYQSEGDLQQELEGILDSLDVPFTSKERDRRGEKYGDTEYKTTRKDKTYYIPSWWAKPTLREDLDGKVPKNKFLSLSGRQFRMFMGAFILGDGNIRGRGHDADSKLEAINEWIETGEMPCTMTCGSKDPDMIDFLQSLCVRNGVRTKRTERDDEFYHLHLSDKHTMTGIDGEFVEYEGRVWCVSVMKNKTLVLRRNGRTFIAGNTQYLLADGSRAMGGSLSMNNNDISGAGEIEAEYSEYNTGTSNPPHQEGRLFYDDTDKALTYFNDDPAISLQVGQEEWVRVYNDTGNVISNGDAVYVTGADSGSGLPTVAKAQANDVAKSEVVGVATHEIGLGEIGYCTITGVVKGVDTSNFTNGSTLYLSASTAGALTDTKPGGSHTVTKVGFTALSASAPDGKILVELGTVVEGLRVSGDDTAPGELDEKLVGGSAITTSTLNPGGDEDLEVDVGTIDDTQHGDRGGGSLHADATETTDGFMSSVDKTKLNKETNPEYGNDYQNAQALTRTTTTSQSYVDKVALTTGTLDGTYQIEWQAVGDLGNKNNLAYFRLQNTTDAATVGVEQVMSISSASERLQVGGFAEVSFASVSKDFVLQYRGDGGTVGIQDARIKIKQVST